MLFVNKGGLINQKCRDLVLRAPSSLRRKMGVIDKFVRAQPSDEFRIFCPKPARLQMRHCFFGVLPPNEATTSVAKIPPADRTTDCDLKRSSTWQRGRPSPERQTNLYLLQAPASGHRSVLRLILRRPSPWQHLQNCETFVRRLHNCSSNSFQATVLSFLCTASGAGHRMWNPQSE